METALVGTDEQQRFRLNYCKTATDLLIQALLRTTRKRQSDFSADQITPSLKPKLPTLFSLIFYCHSHGVNRH